MPVNYKKYSSDYSSLSRREYYERMIFPKSVSLFSELWQPEKNGIPIDVPVVFRGLHFGDSPNIVSRKMGEPRFVIENHGLSSLIFFYKEKINSHRVITQVHFLGEEFFYACYTFRYENEAERTRIKEMLFEKYMPSKAFKVSRNPEGLVSNGDAIETNNHLIDRENNIVSVFDMVNFNILYMWGNDTVKKMVYSSVTSSHFKKQTSQKELLSKL